MSLGNCVFTKSTTLTAWRSLAPPRDILRARPSSTSNSAPPPLQCTRNDITQTLPRWQLPFSGPRSALNILDAADNIDPIIATSKPTIQKQQHIVHEDLPWANVVVWKDTLHDVDIENPTMVRYWASDKKIARKVAWDYKSQRHKIAKALELTVEADEYHRESHWRHSLNLLNAHTEIPEDGHTPKSLLDKGYEDQRDCREQQSTQMHALHIPRPYVWSTATFKCYVEALVTSSVTGTLHGQLYNADDSHIKSITCILLEIFGNPRLESYLSIAACHSAMSFFYKISQLSAARSILSRMEDLDLLTSPETFNILLRGSVKCKDTSHFEYLLKKMLEKGMKANAETWVLFFQISDTEEAKSEVYRNMRDKNVLNNAQVMARFLSVTAREMLVKYLENGQSISKLLEYFGGLDRVLWKSPAVGNVLLDEMGNRGSVRDVMNILKQLEQHGMRFDEVTLNTMLHQCTPNRDHDEAIWILKWFREKHSLLPGRLAYDALFRQTWRSRLSNCAKVVWRFACSEGFVTYNMKKSVSKSLLDDIPMGPTLESVTRGDIWRTAAGRLVVGLRPGKGEGFASLRPPSSIASTSMEEPTGVAVSQYSQHEEEKYSVWTERFCQDLALAHQVHIKDHLDVLLRRALAMDRQWALEEVCTKKSLKWILRHSIQVELKQYYPSRFLPMNHPGRHWDHYIEQQHISKYRAENDSNVEYRPLELHSCSDRSTLDESGQEGLTSKQISDVGDHSHCK